MAEFLNIRFYNSTNNTILYQIKTSLGTLHACKCFIGIGAYNKQFVMRVERWVLYAVQFYILKLDIRLAPATSVVLFTNSIIVISIISVRLKYKVLVSMAVLDHDPRIDPLLVRTELNLIKHLHFNALV